MSSTELPYPEEIARIERFIGAYNAVDEFFQQELRVPQTFRSNVDLWAKRHPWWRDAEQLRLYATMRNFLVHERILPFDYPCVPSEAAVRDLAAIKERLLNPTRLGDEFLHEVVTLSGGATLERALELMNSRGHSRFPIYEGNQFLGMLTERGIAGALAAAVGKGRELDLQIFVRTLLPRESKRKSHRFAPPEMLVSQAAHWFHDNVFLEAVLITDDGHEAGHLRGIVTRGDVAGRVE